MASVGGADAPSADNATLTDVNGDRRQDVLAINATDLGVVRSTRLAEARDPGGRDRP